MNQPKSDFIRQASVPKRFSSVILCVAISLAVWAYGPALDAEFVFDDITNIVDSPAVHWNELSGQNLDNIFQSPLLKQRPVANISFALNHLVGGLDPEVFHLTNLIIHGAVTAALLLLCWLYIRVVAGPRRADASSSMAFAAAAMSVSIFLLHPLNTQAVTYVVQRMTSLAALFTLLAFAGYLVARYRLTRFPILWYCAAIVMWILGLGSKEIAVLLLPVVVLFEFCFFRSSWQAKVEQVLRISWSRYWTAGTLVLASFLVGATFYLAMTSSDVIRLTQDFPGRDFNGIERLMTQARVQVFYLSQLFWPSPGRLNIDHAIVTSTSLLNPLSTLPAIVFCILLISIGAVLCVRIPKYGFPLVAYAMLHSIEAGPIGLEMIFEHRMYLPMTMLTLAAATAIYEAPAQRLVPVAILGLFVLIVLSWWTHSRNQVWADPLALQSDIASKSPSKSRAQHNFALALYDAGLSEKALPVIRRALALDDKSAVSNKLLGDILLDLEVPDEALAAYRKAVALDPTDVRNLLGLGNALLTSGNAEAAHQHYLEYGVKLGRSGYPWQAISILKEAVQMRPKDASSRSALGSAYMAAGLNEQALVEFRLATELDPSKLGAWFNIGLVSTALNRKDEAIDAYQEFIERAPPEMQQTITSARMRIEELSREITGR